MADTRADVAIPAGVWTDVTTASGVAAGTACTVYNKGSNPVYVATKATAPTGETFGVPIVPLYNDGRASVVVASGTAKVWAYSEKGTVVLQQD